MSATASGSIAPTSCAFSTSDPGIGDLSTPNVIRKSHGVWLTFTKFA
jgi:hypothetical protein